MKTINIARFLMIPCTAAVCFLGENAIAESTSCATATTTQQINACSAHELKSTEAIMRRYLTAALGRIEPEAARQLENSQRAWSDFSDAYCGTVYQHWIEGTVRSSMQLRCKIARTNERTRMIWQDFLTFMDSTPPVLPDPTSTAQ